MERVDLEVQEGNNEKIKSFCFRNIYYRVVICLALNMYDDEYGILLLRMLTCNINNQLNYVLCGEIH